MNWQLPLYDTCQNAELSNPGANAGLRFTKFANAWATDAEKMLVFNDPAANRDWFNLFNQKQVGQVEQLKEAAERLWQLVDKLDGAIIGLKNSNSRFVSGMGLEHPTENGMTWHPTLGVPYLPGSGLKGAVRAYAYDSGSEKEREDFDKQSGNETFGKRDSIGAFVFTDLLPVRPVTLVTEVMTPHYGPYYQAPSDAPIAPGDWHSPVPIKFLAVEANQSWICGVVPISARADSREHSLEEIRQILLEALTTSGIGAKNSSGMGYFEADETEVNRIKTRVETRLANARIEMENQARLREADPQEIVLIELSRNWPPGSDDKQYRDIVAFLDNLKGNEISEAAVHWLRVNYLEIKDKGIWDEPDRMKGKHKDQPAFNKRKVEITKRIQSILTGPRN